MYSQIVTPPRDTRVSLFESGFEFIDNFVPLDTIEAIKDDLSKQPMKLRGGGIRNAEKKLTTVNTLVRSESVLEKARRYLPGEPSIVRVILFIKSPQNNWLVSWHQDKTVTVSSHFECRGWGPWSTKDRVLHVQPPMDVLEQMVTFRIHLDKSTPENGCLRLIPGSHKQGLISQEEIQSYAEKNTPIFCEANVGSVLVMRPHVVHASSKAKIASQRRVLHIELSSYMLPRGVSWA